MSSEANDWGDNGGAWGNENQATNEFTADGGDTFTTNGAGDNACRK
jgi:hypothetical protein